MKLRSRVMQGMLGGFVLLAYAATLGLAFSPTPVASGQEPQEPVIEKDAEGRVIRTVDASGWETRYRRDDDGRVIEILLTNTEGRTAVRQFTYDLPLGRLVRETDCCGRDALYEYDAGPAPTRRKADPGFVPERDTHSHFNRHEDSPSDE